MKKIEHTVEAIILASRWLLVVFYLGLAFALLLYALSFMSKLYDFVDEALHAGGDRHHPEDAGPDRRRPGGEPRRHGHHLGL